MRIAAVIPVKPLERALGRLSSVLSAAERRELQVAMLADLLGACRSCADIAEILVVTDDAGAADLCRASGATVLADHRPPQGMNPAVRIGQSYAAASGCDAVLVLTADLPLVRAVDLTRILDALGAPRGAVLVPSRDGTGTNALALAPPLAIATRLGVNSRAHHELALLEAGVGLAQLDVPTLALDVDTPEDLLALATREGTGLAADRCAAWGVAERLVAGAVP